MDTNMKIIGYDFLKWTRKLMKKLILASTSSLLREVFTFKLNRRKSVALEVKLASRCFLNLCFARLANPPRLLLLS